MTSHHLLVHFYNPHSSENDRDENVFNRTVASFDPPFCHCELQFMNQESITVYANKKVSIKKRSFDMTTYVTLCVPCGPKQYNAAYASAHCLVNKSFSWLALLNSKFRLFSKISSGTFCSDVCAIVLLSAQALSPSTNTAHITPSLLFYQLQKQGAQDADSYASSTRPSNSTTPSKALDWDCDGRRGGSDLVI